MSRATIAALALVVWLGSLGSASAQQNIRGYTYCGTKDFGTGAWHYGEPDGAFLNAYARRMSCFAARRNVDRTKSSSKPPYRPYRTGYRCRELVSRHEYSSVRCVKRGGTRAYRYITGA